MNGAKPGEGMDNHPGEHIGRVSVYGCDRNLRYTWVVSPPPGFAVAAMIGRRDDEIRPAAAVAELTAFKQSAIDTGQSRLGEFEICFSGNCPGLRGRSNQPEVCDQPVRVTVEGLEDIPSLLPGG